MTTNADVLRLQNHYSTQHPMTFHEGFWYQKISDEEGDILIAKFGIDDCNMDDCHFSREDRRKEKQNKYTTPHMKIRLVKSHAVCFQDYLTEEDIEKNGLFSCLHHGDGVVDEMIDLFQKFGLMYMWKMGQDNMKLRYKHLPPALINKIKANKLFPQVIKTTCAQLPTQKNKKTALNSMANTVQFLKRKVAKLNKRNAELEEQNNNAVCSVCYIAIRQNTESETTQDQSEDEIIQDQMFDLTTADLTPLEAQETAANEQEEEMVQDQEQEEETQIDINELQTNAVTLPETVEIQSEQSTSFELNVSTGLFEARFELQTQQQTVPLDQEDQPNQQEQGAHILLEESLSDFATILNTNLQTIAPIQAHSNYEISRVRSLTADNYGEGTSAMDMSMPPLPPKEQKMNLSSSSPLPQSKKKMVRRKLTAEQLKFKCDQCDGQYGAKQTLTRHYKTYHIGHIVPY